MLSSIKNNNYNSYINVLLLFTYARYNIGEYSNEYQKKNDKMRGDTSRSKFITRAIEVFVNKNQVGEKECYDNGGPTI